MNSPPDFAPLTDLLPLRFAGGFVVDHIQDECETCHRSCGMREWSARVHWMSASRCLLDAQFTCNRCATTNLRKVRIAGMPDGTGEFIRLVDGQWRTDPVTNITMMDRMRLKMEAFIGGFRK